MPPEVLPLLTTAATTPRPRASWSAGAQRVGELASGEHGRCSPLSSAPHLTTLLSEPLAAHGSADPPGTFPKRSGAMRSGSWAVSHHVVRGNRARRASGLA